MEIIWAKPSLDEESHEYFGTWETKDLFDGMGYEFASKDEFLGFFGPVFDVGRLVQMDYELTWADGIGKVYSKDPVPLEGKYGLQKRVKDDNEYGANYYAMHEAVKEGRPLTLPAPIYFYFKEEGFGFYFSGDRRKLLAYNLNLPLKVWWVDVMREGKMNEAEYREAVVGLFDDIERKYDETAKKYRIEVSGLFDELGPKIEEFKKERLCSNRSNSGDFNVFKYLLGGDPDENTMSDILKDMLDPDGKHGQGDLFLRLFLKYLNEEKGASLNEKESVSPVNIFSYREKPTDEGRLIDIYLQFKNKFILAIENKIGAADQEDQVKDYIGFVKKSSNGNFIFIYLSVEGLPPAEISISVAERKGYEKNKQFIALSYRKDICQWLKKCIERCESDKYRYFINDLLGLSFIRGESAMDGFADILKESLNTPERFRIALDIYGNFDEIKKPFREKFYEEFAERARKDNELDENWIFCPNLNPDDRTYPFGFYKKEWGKNGKWLYALAIWPSEQKSGIYVNQHILSFNETTIQQEKESFLRVLSLSGLAITGKKCWWALWAENLSETMDGDVKFYTALCKDKSRQELLEECVQNMAILVNAVNKGAGDVIKKNIKKWESGAKNGNN